MARQHLCPCWDTHGEQRACCQGKVRGGLISTSVGCWLIGLIGDLSLEAQCRGQGRPWDRGLAGCRQVQLPLPPPGEGRAGPHRHLGAAPVCARAWQAGPVTEAAPLGKGRSSWRGRWCQPSCSWEEKGAVQSGSTQQGWARRESPGVFLVETGRTWRWGTMGCGGQRPLRSRGKHLPCLFKWPWHVCKDLSLATSYMFGSKK